MMTILVSDFYNVSVFYPHMTPAFFNALEQAFIDGKETADVSASDYDAMIKSFVAHSKLQNYEHNNESIIRATSVF